MTTRQTRIRPADEVISAVARHPLPKWSVQTVTRQNDNSRNRSRSTNNQRESGNSPEDEGPGSLWGRLPLESETTWYILASCLDIFLTYLLLRHQNFQEANPIARYFLDHWGWKGMIYFKLAMVAFVTVLAQIIATRKPETARRLLIFASLVVGGVVIYSISLYVRHVL